MSRLLNEREFLDYARAAVGHGVIEMSDYVELLLISDVDERVVRFTRMMTKDISNTNFLTPVGIIKL